MPPGAWAAVLLAIAGVCSLWPTALSLWSLWTTDALKSIGGLVPLVSLWLIVRAWRALEWEQEGSWWGVVILAATIALVSLRRAALLELVLGPSWSITLPPHSLVAFAYAAGTVLTVGGRRLWRAARFPVLLMLLVNPVPHSFSTRVDLPLQHAASTIARGLAHLLGQTLTPDQLSLMFTPQFGMFIAPGCNGLRGAVTMGLIALVAGYLYRFRLRAWAGLVLGGVLLGYVFNLLRLCVLVVFYLVALRWPVLQGHAEGADYLLGALLFFGATMLLFAAIRRFSPAKDLRLPPPFVPGSSAPRAGSRQPRSAFALRLAVVALLEIGAGAAYLGHAQPSPSAETRVHFPVSMGPFALRRTWVERLDTGQPIFNWAEYAAPGGDYAVQMGVSAILGAHDTLLCHVARGERWSWHGSLSLPSAGGAVAFTGTELQDGVTTSLEASTLCSEAGCGQWTPGSGRFGLVISRVTAASTLPQAQAEPVPVLLRVELPESSEDPAAVRAVLLTHLEAFTRYASFDAFKYRYLRP